MQTHFIRFAAIIVALASIGSVGCTNATPTVTPADAVKVPAEAPVGEEKPSTDEQ